MMKRTVYILLAIGVVGLVATMAVVGWVGRSQPASANCPIILPVQEIGGYSLTNSYRPYKCVVLEKVSSPEARIQGLSGRESLAETAGMLFVFDRQEEQCMWMKDMRFGLDIIWLDDRARITRIKQRVDPNTFPQSFCHEAKYVVEVNAGIAASAGLRVGERIKLP